MTLKNLRALDDEARFAALEVIAVEKYGPMWATKVATLLELAPSTVFRWKLRPATMPFMALMVLHGMEELAQPQPMPAPPPPDTRIKEAAAALIQVSRALSRTAEVLTAFSEPVSALQTVHPETLPEAVCLPESAA